MNGERSASPEDANYNDFHRAFLQAFLSQPVMSVDELGPLIESISRAYDFERPLLVNDVTQPYINSIVQAVNAKLASLDYEIRSTKDQNSRTLIYSLVNTTSDTFTQLATSFSPDEIAYIKRVLDEMFEKNNTQMRELMAVKGMAATNLARVRRDRQSHAVDAEEEDPEANNAKSIKHDEAERVLLQLVKEGFFQKSNKGYYSLAPRALMELRTYLKDTYNELPIEGDDEPPIIRIKDCEACREIVTVGLRCSNRECPIRWHEGCARQYFRQQQGRAVKCPKCDTAWTGNVFVGEKADRVPRPSNTAGRSSRRVVDEEENGDENGDVDGEEDDE